MKIHKRFAGIVVGAAALALAGCHNYVKREEFDAAVAELRNSDTVLRSDLNALKATLDAKLKNYDATISQLQGRISVDMAAHFDTDKAALREQDKPALQQFASVMREHHSSAIVTVEGFTDGAGSAAYNKRLGQRRADAVRNYLVQEGLPAERVRAVSYGEAASRQIVKGATQERGQPNRRVVLVIDHVERTALAPLPDMAGSAG